MIGAVTTTAVSARDLILLAAERLVGEQGVSVSLREVAIEAGQRNNSAVHYHFGSRDGLIEAVVVLRVDELERRRLGLIAEYDEEGLRDVRSLVDVLVRPMFTAPYEQGSTHYARFLEKVRDHPAITARPLGSEQRPATRIVISRLDQALSELPAEVRKQRLQAMTTTMFALLADLERTREHTAGHTPESPEVEQGIIDMLVGLLTAPHHGSSTEPVARIVQQSPG